jgi:LacI family transcriptional regulator
MAKPETLSTDYLKEIVLDASRDLPLHAQLRKALEDLIADRFEDQQRFYSETQLLANLNVSQGTVRRALADLATRGTLEKRQARCTIVRKQSASGGLKNLAVFLPDYTSEHVAKILTELNAECMNRDIRMQPIYTHRGERLLKAYGLVSFGPKEGGVVLLENSRRATVELASALGDAGYRCVVVSTMVKGADYRFVGGRNDAMMNIGLQHLADLGHKRIAVLVNEPEEKGNVRERVAAFEAWGAERPGFELIVARSGVHLWDDPKEGAAKAMEIAMQSDPKPTAIFAISDVGAIRAISWLQQHGLRVPQDISVIGLGNSDFTTMFHPTLTTLTSRPNEHTEGIFRLLEDDKNEIKQIFLEPHLLVRESTAPPPKRKA